VGASKKLITQDLTMNDINQLREQIEALQLQHAIAKTAEARKACLDQIEQLQKQAQEISWKNSSKRTRS